MREGQIGHERTECEQAGSGEGEREGVFLLVRFQARGDEAPELEERDGQGDQEPAVCRHVETQREPCRG